jgi:hypothetical protein
MALRVELDHLGRASAARCPQRKYSRGKPVARSHHADWVAGRNRHGKFFVASYRESFRFQRGNDYILVGRFAIGAMSVILLNAPARAEIAVAADVPFTARELTTALAVRDVPVDDVAVRAISRTVVELWTPIGHHRIDLGDAHGSAAARLVALQLAPLSLEAAPGAPFALPAPPVVHDHGWKYAFSAGGGRGIEDIDLGVAMLRGNMTWARGRWRCGGDLAWLHELPGSQDPSGDITADFVVVRAIAGLALGSVALVAGPELAPYRVTGAVSGVTVGVGASLRMLFFAGDHWQALATLDLDVLRHRVVLERDGIELAATPRIVVTTALGIAWGTP